MSSQYTFTGQFTFSIDSKNRVNIPAPIRRQFLKKDKKTFVVTRGIDQCAWIYPISEWNLIDSAFFNLPHPNDSIGGNADPNQQIIMKLEKNKK